MRKLYFIALLPLLAACGQTPGTSQATIDLDYANTSLGFRNSGALSAGRLMLWDTSDNSLVSLATDIPLSSKAPTTSAKLEASSVKGASIKAGVKLTDKANGQIESNILNNLSFVITDAVRVDNTRVYSGISSAYTALIAEGVDPRRSWRVDDAVTSPARYKFVLLRDEVRASQETIVLDKSASGKASFTVTDEVSGDITVTIPNKTTAKCSGTQVVCYVNATVMQVYINASGGLDYAPVSYDRRALSRALRNLG